MEKIVVEEEKKFHPAKNQKSIDSESYQMSVSQSQSEQRNEEEPIPVLVKSKWLVGLTAFKFINSISFKFLLLKANSRSLLPEQLTHRNKSAILLLSICKSKD